MLWIKIFNHLYPTSSFVNVVLAVWLKILKFAVRTVTFDPLLDDRRQNWFGIFVDNFAPCFGFSAMWQRFGFYFFSHGEAEFSRKSPLEDSENGKLIRLIAHCLFADQVTRTIRPCIWIYHNISCEFCWKCYYQVGLFYYMNDDDL